MHKLTRILFTFIFLLTGFCAMAQESAAPAEPPFMEQNGKIYVVVAVVVTIVLGLIAYVIRLDQKISRLEKETDAATVHND